MRCQWNFWGKAWHSSFPSVKLTVTKNWLLHPQPYINICLLLTTLKQNNLFGNENQGTSLKIPGYFFPPENQTIQLKFCLCFHLLKDCDRHNNIGDIRGLSLGPAYFRIWLCRVRVAEELFSSVEVFVLGRSILGSWNIFFLFPINRLY